jgi:hypothetical protein
LYFVAVNYPLSALMIRDLLKAKHAAPCLVHNSSTRDPMEWVSLSPVERDELQSNTVINGSIYGTVKCGRVHRG